MTQPQTFQGPCGHLFPKPNKPPTRLRRLPLKIGKPVTFRMVAEFYINGELNMELWRKLKLPPGWRKCPRPAWKEIINFPVRIYTYHPVSLSAAEMETLEAQIALLKK